MPKADSTAFESIRALSAVGIALSAEKDERRLMELIVQSAKQLTNADGGTFYSRTEDDELKFEIMHTDTLGIHMGGTSGIPIDLPNIPLFDKDGKPNHKMVAAKAAVSGQTVNIRDAYNAPDFDFSGTRAFDETTGYRSKSFLTVPLRNHEDEVIGVLQLINAVSRDTGGLVSFSIADQELVMSLASQAATVLTKDRLIKEHRTLFEAFIELIAAAIDDKSPYTGGHCRRVPELTLMLADAAAQTQYGPLKDFTMSEDDRYELNIAGWLHDCGKVTTPEHVVDKATKLETIVDRIHTINARFEVLKRDAQIRVLEQKLEAREKGKKINEKKLDAALAAELEQLERDREFLGVCNVGSEYMAKEDQERVERIGAYKLIDGNGNEATLLSDDEIYNLSIEKGTLNAEEREIINQHIVTTIKMLESLPYPKNLRRVPEFACGHHEKMDGTGYPRGLKREEMSVQARIMGIADIFEALTADDRPYKAAMPISEALRILGTMKLNNHIDPDLFDVFIRKKVYLKYAQRFLEPRQIDHVDLSKIPGYETLADEIQRKTASMGGG
ncbi:MAG: GAF domain-containing protein [Gammaproteobacteria bacterium]|nr:GAF domain-containing protein [Gammaproteobacteria bacterium]NIM74925.1 GAF domain-containing protein [Gammaproteobacteria bacterium]NIN39714.1 GAF domain-containing protein [Gammaproteobacteria bacterium]NIO26842.1 GAF domain-containing protein [Gammaproteobacteria bacterium]NIO67398.1 GAF domain-containing protein [Gammaproteobacteria bacterium]